MANSPLSFLLDVYQSGGVQPPANEYKQTAKVHTPRFGVFETIRHRGPTSVKLSKEATCKSIQYKAGQDTLSVVISK